MGFLIFCVINYAVHLFGLVVLPEKTIENAWAFFLTPRIWPAPSLDPPSRDELAFIEYQIFLGVQMYIAFALAALLLLRRAFSAMRVLRVSLLERPRDFILVTILMLLSTWVLLKNGHTDPAGNPLPLSTGPLWWRMIYLGGMWPFVIGIFSFQLVDPKLMNESFAKHENRKR